MNGYGSTELVGLLVIVDDVDPCEADGREWN